MHEYSFNPPRGVAGTGISIAAADPRRYLGVMLLANLGNSGLWRSNTEKSNTGKEGVTECFFFHHFPVFQVSRIDF